MTTLNSLFLLPVLIVIAASCEKTSSYRDHFPPIEAEFKTVMLGAPVNPVPMQHSNDFPGCAFSIFAKIIITGDFDFQELLDCLQSIIFEQTVNGTDIAVDLTAHSVGMGFAFARRLKSTTGVLGIKVKSTVGYPLFFAIKSGYSFFGPFSSDQILNFDENEALILGVSTNDIPVSMTASNKKIDKLEELTVSDKNPHHFNVHQTDFEEGTYFSDGSVVGYQGGKLVSGTNEYGADYAVRTARSYCNEEMLDETFAVGKRFFRRIDSCSYAYVRFDVNPFTCGVTRGQTLNISGCSRSWRIGSQKDPLICSQNQDGSVSMFKQDEASLYQVGPNQPSMTDCFAYDDTNAYGFSNMSMIHYFIEGRRQATVHKKIANLPLFVDETTICYHDPKYPKVICGDLSFDYPEGSSLLLFVPAGFNRSWIVYNQDGRDYISNGALRFVPIEGEYRNAKYSQNGNSLIVNAGYTITRYDPYLNAIMMKAPYNITDFIFTKLDGYTSRGFFAFGCEGDKTLQSHYIDKMQD